MSSNVYVLGLGAYLAFSIADACIKAVGGRLGVFETATGMIFCAVAVLLVRPPAGERWWGFWRTSQPLRVHGRALCGLISGIGSVYAFSTVPLVDVYAIVFLAPFFVTLMSTLLLREQVGPWRWGAVALGFAGVLIAVRPGLREVEPGHLAAVASGFATGTAIIIMRSLDNSVRRTSVLGMLFAYGLTVNAVMMLATGVVVPTAWELGILALGGVMIGVGQTALLAATRSGAASQVAPAAYSPLVWAIVIGAVFFDEMPDLAAIAGMACIVVAGLLTVLREQLRRPKSI